MPSIKNTKPLYLASGSVSRQSLLRQAGIRFIVINHTANEKSCVWDSFTTPQELVLFLARLKMAHACLPELVDTREDNDQLWVLTADTVTYDAQKKIYGKPDNRQEAYRMIRALGNKSFVTTGFVLEKKEYQKDYQAGKWVTVQRYEDVVTAWCELGLADLPDVWLDYYLDNSASLDSSGAVALEALGGLFVKGVYGSYSAILGLPLYELFQGLTELGFFESVFS